MLNILHNELTFIKESVQPYNANKVIYQDPIRLSAPTRLLDGEILDYNIHGSLIVSLLKFQVAVTKYNDFIQITNSIQNIPTISDKAHKQIYENILRLHGDVYITKEEVLNSIPP